MTRMMRKHPYWLSITSGLCLLLLLPLQPARAENVTSEYQLKAALLYKLTKFVQWPVAGNAASGSTSFGLCVLGENYFGNKLDALESRKVEDRAIVIHYYEQSDAVSGNCDLVFISDSKRAFLKPILKSLRQQPILTVGDMPGFADDGGMIQFTLGKRIGFKINISSAKNVGLKISAPLLQLATIVEATN